MTIDKLKGKIFQGALFGVIAIVGMLHPFVLTAGVMFDGRSVAISLCTLFFGPPAGIIASVMALAYRLYAGGVGMITGILIIISSFCVGCFFYKRRQKDKLTIFALPSDLTQKAYKAVGLTILGIYPLVSLMVGRILLDQEEQISLLEELTTSESKFRALADLSPYAIFIYQDEKFRYVNNALMELSGYSKEELLQIPLWDLIHDDHRRTAKERGLKRQRGIEVENRYRLKLVKKGGQEYWVDFCATTIEYEGEKAVLGTAYDITERVMYMQAVEEQKELFETTLYSIGDAVITTNIHGAVQHMNPVAEVLTGWSEEEAKDKCKNYLKKRRKHNAHTDSEPRIRNNSRDGKTNGARNDKQDE